MSARSEQFRAKVEADPDNPLYRFSLGQSLHDEGAPAEAIPHLTACAEHRSDWMLPRILLGKCLLAENRAEEAKPVLEDALELAVRQEHDDPAEEVRGLLADLGR